MSDFLPRALDDVVAAQGRHGGSLPGLLWRGTSPTRLIIRGVSQTAISLFFAWLFVKLSSGEFTELTDQAGGAGWLVALTALALLFAAIGVISLVVGIADVVLSRRVIGTVLSARERRTGDQLPWWVQPVISRWDQPGAVDRPRYAPRIRRWHEVVLTSPEDTTGHGVRWTASPRQAHRLRAGSELELKVGPLLGHVRSLREVGEDHTS